MSNLALLGIGLLSFLLTLGAGATGTYAWFTLTKFANVSFTEFKINENTGLQIGMKNSKGTIDYFQDIKDEDLAKYNVSYHPGSEMTDTSSMYGRLWLNETTKYDTDFPQLRTTYGVGNHKESGKANSGYLQFEFYLLAEEDMYLFLSDDETSVRARHEDNLEIAKRIQESGRTDVTVEDLDNVQNASRVSFFSEDGFYIYEPNALTGSATTYGGLLDLVPIDGYYDNDSNKEIVYGEYDTDDKIIYGDPLEEDIPVVGRASTFNAAHKKGVRPFDYAASVANGFKFAQEKTYTLDQLGISKDEGQFDPRVKTPIAKLRGHVPHRLVTTIYIEGWDLDVTQYITSAKFNVNLAFRGLAAPIKD
ncbi:MAG: hypothetical protein MJ239_05875 [Bacilli bacterium]|nr:hypothetical protein [Bacilli bacterium]